MAYRFCVVSHASVIQQSGKVNSGKVNPHTRCTLD